MTSRWTWLAVPSARWRPSVAQVWAGFAVVHLHIAWLGVWLVPNQVFWDLRLYRFWMADGWVNGVWPVFDGPWVYPAGALVPLLVVGLFSNSDTWFFFNWTVLVTAANLYVTVRLLRHRGGRAAAAWWVLFVAALGAVYVGRLDALVPPLAIGGLLAASRHPKAAGVLLTIGAWIKVAPGALLLPVVMAVRHGWKQTVQAAAAVCGAVVAAVGLLGGPQALGHITSFLFTQGDRGMQVEAVGASPWLVWGLFSDAVTREYNSRIITFEVYGPGVETAWRLLDAAFFVAVVLTAWLLWRRRANGPDPLPTAELLARGSLLVMLTMVVTNKVLSPQYMTWLVAPVVVALAWQLPGWRRTAWSLLAVAAATQLVFPWLYEDMLAGQPLATVVLVARNLALVGLWVACVHAVVRRPSDKPALPADQPAGDEVTEEPSLTG